MLSKLRSKYLDPRVTLISALVREACFCSGPLSVTTETSGQSAETHSGAVGFQAQGSGHAEEEPEDGKVGCEELPSGYGRAVLS